jgi:hypothetical protein
MKRILAVLTGLATFAAASAHAVGTLTDVTVYDRSEGRVLPVYQHQGRHYVVGKPGNEYQVVVSNRTPGDVLAVISVDGVNAVTGETANWSQTGYVFGGNQSYAIAGWRKSLDRIATFFFTDLGNSYAARTGRPDNVGVIGVAVFRRKSEPPVAVAPPRTQPYPYPRRDRYESPAAASEAPAPYAEGTVADSANEAGRAAPAPIQERQRAESKLGTGHGRSETSVVTNTQFDRESPAPNEVITLYYDTYRNLVAQGVIRERPVAVRPAPFPGQFVPDPR